MRHPGGRRRISTRRDYLPIIETLITPLPLSTVDIEPATDASLINFKKHNDLIQPTHGSLARSLRSQRFFARTKWLGSLATRAASLKSKYKTTCLVEHQA